MSHSATRRTRVMRLLTHQPRTWVSTKWAKNARRCRAELRHAGGVPLARRPRDATIITVLPGHGKRLEPDLLYGGARWRVGFGPPGGVALDIAARSLQPIAVDDAQRVVSLLPEQDRRTEPLASFPRHGGLEGSHDGGDRTVDGGTEAPPAVVVVGSRTGQLQDRMAGCVESEPRGSINRCAGR
jgi:hypothetical protein